MKEDMKTAKSKVHNDGVNRRNFIAKTVLAGAGMAITALPEDGNAKTTKQEKKPAGASKPGHPQARPIRGFIGRYRSSYPGFQSKPWAGISERFQRM